MPPHTLVCVCEPSDATRLVAAAAVIAPPARACQAGLGLATALAHDRPRTLITEPAIAADDRVLRQLIAGEFVRCVTLVKDTTPRTSSAVVRLCASYGAVKLLTYNSIKALGDILADGIHPGYGAAAEIVKYVIAYAPLALQGPMTIAAILAEKRTSVSQLAVDCQTPVRTLEWQFRRANLPTIRHTLGWMVALHVSAKRDRGVSMKQIAASAGFADASTLANYVRRHVGLTPRAATEAGGFAYLSQCFRAKWLSKDEPIPGLLRVVK